MSLRERPATPRRTPPVPPPILEASRGARTRPGRSVGPRRICAPLRLVLALLLLLPGAARVARAAATTSPASGEEPRRLRVILAEPVGEQRDLHEISVSFDAPMVRLGERGKNERRGPIRFDPPLRGAFTWLGTSTASFQLEAPPPAGTRVTCTVPADTRSLSGDRLGADHVWTIEYRRPRLLAAVPRVARPREGRSATSPGHPLDDPFLFAFDRAPAPGAARAIRIRGPEGDLRLTSVPVEPEHLAALFGRGASGVRAEQVLVLRADRPLQEDAEYVVTVPADLPFAGAALGLSETVEFPFRSLAPLRVLGAEAEDGAVVILFAAPVDPDSLLARARLAPRPRDLRAFRSWETPGGVRLSGSFPPGKRVRIEIPPELTDLFGRALGASFTAELEMPHAEPLLALFPSSGVLMPDPDPEVQVRARNVRAVRMSAAWILSDEMPRYLAWAAPERERRGRASPSPAPPWEARRIELPPWDAPELAADSICVFRRELARIGPPPAGAHALLFAVEAVERFPGIEPGPPDTLREQSLVRVSPVGLSCTLGEESGLLWVTDLKSGQPVANAAVSLWAAADTQAAAPAALWRGRTDADGLASLPGRRILAARGVPRLALAETSAGASWLELTPPPPRRKRGFDPPNGAFLFTDRPIYRPGEAIRWKAYVRESDARGLHPVRALPVRAELRIGGETLRRDHVLAGSGNADGSFTLPAGGRTGHATLRLLQPLPDGTHHELASVPVQVEEFRAPRFEAKVETTTPRVLSGETARLTARFGYFAGGPLAGAPIRWHLSRQPSGFRPRGWSEFSFDDPLPAGRRRGHDWMGPMVVQQGEATLDVNGRAELAIPVILPPEEGDSRVTVEVAARDLADQSAADRVRLEVLRGPWRPGVSALWDEPESRGRGRWRWVVVDTAGVAVPDVPVTLELWRRDWKTVRIRRLGGTFDYENAPRDSLLARLEEVSAAEARSIELPLAGAGLYLLRARWRAPDGSDLVGGATRWFGGEETAAFPRETAQWIGLELDRERAQPDDTVHVVVPTPVGGARGLLLLESGGLLRAEPLDLHGTPTLSVPLGGIAPPDVTLTAVLVGPDRVPSDDAGGPRRFLPYFARGSRTLRLAEDRWRAQVEVIPAVETAEPGEEVAVEIRLRDPQGRPLSGEVTFAAVDEAVLALARETDPDPLSSLFAYRGSGTEYDDTRYQLQLMPAEEKGESSPGGGGAEGAAMGRLRARFDLTAYWNPSVPIGPDGVGTVRFRLPEALTRYRLRAVAACAGELFGVGDARLRVDRPLSVEAAGPRLARAGDRWTLGAVLQNRAREPLSVEVRCAVRGGRITGDTSWNGVLEPGRIRRVDFLVRTPDPGTFRYTLRATGRGAAGAHDDAVSRTLPVEFAAERITEVAFGRAAPRAEEEIDLESPGFAGSGRLTAALSPTLVSELRDAVDYLLEFPHACVEQIDSRLLGLLARRDLAHRFSPDSLTPAAVDARIAEGLGELASRMEAATFRVWPSGPSGHPYLDAYTLYVLARLRQRGLPVPDALHEGALEIARRHARRPAGDRPRIEPDVRAFLLWARAEASDPQLLDSEMEAAVQLQDRMGTAGQLALLLALDRFSAARPDQPYLRQTTNSRIQKTIEALSGRMDRTARSAFLSEIEDGPLGRWTAGGHGRVRAGALAVMLLSRSDPNHPLLPPLAHGLMAGRRHGRWANTHENALALEAVREYAARAEALRLPTQGRLILGLGRTEGVRFAEDDLRPRSFSYSLAELLGLRRADPRTARLPVTIEGDGRAALYYQMRLDRFVSGLESVAEENGMVLYREYLDAATGRRLDVLTRGQPILVHLALVVPRDSDFLVLEDPLPAGVEAVNLELLTSSQLAHRLRPESAGRPEAPEDEESAWSRPEEELAFRAAAPGGETGRILRVQHRDLRDDRARFYADEVPAGIYHLYYPVAATTPGVFGTPSARVERLYDPEVYGTSGAQRVEVR